eukprot:jgi/Hompol1/66/HPOL_003132-RA
MRVLGELMPSRAFGDARFKWPLKLQHKIDRLFDGLPGSEYMWRRPQHLYTPPYVTASPEIIHHKLDPSDRFLIIATDGVLDFLTSTQLVNTVATYLQYARPSTFKIPLSTLASAATSNTPPISIRHANAATQTVRTALQHGLGDAHAEKLLRIRGPKARNFRDDMTLLVVFFKQCDDMLKDSWKLVKSYREMRHR